MPTQLEPSAEMCYEQIANEIWRRADSGDPDDVRVEADNWVRTQFLAHDEDTAREICGAILGQSERGPHDATIDRHAFDFDDAFGALKALAASSLTSDAIMRGSDPGS